MWSLRGAQINLVFEHLLTWEKKTNKQTKKPSHISCGVYGNVCAHHNSPGCFHLCTLLITQVKDLFKSEKGAWCFVWQF